MVERWNGINSSIYFGKSGEMATNNLEDQEISVLSLHLLQLSLVYIDTLMIQQVLNEPEWLNCIRIETCAHLSLPHSHINPYGVFNLDMKRRLPLNDTVSRLRTHDDLFSMGVSRVYALASVRL